MLISISKPSSLGGSLGYNDSPVSSVAIAVSPSKISPHLVSLSTPLNQALDLFSLEVYAFTSNPGFLIHAAAISFVVNTYSITFFLRIYPGLSVKLKQYRIPGSKCHTGTQV